MQKTRRVFTGGSILLTSLFHLGFLTSCGPNVDSLTTGDYAGTGSPAPSETRRENKTVPRSEHAPSAPASSKSASAEPAKAAKKEDLEVIPWSEYLAYDGEPLEYLKGRALARASRSEFFESMLDVGYALSNMGNFFAPAKRPGKRSFLEESWDEYEEKMDSEYYFMRVRKFRAPEAAKERKYYTTFVAVAPTRRPGAPAYEIASQAHLFKSNTAQLLPPGGVGAGSEWIVAIPREDVQALGGYWNENVDLQFGVIEVDMEAARNRETVKKLSDIAHPVVIVNGGISFYNMNVNQVYPKRYEAPAYGGPRNAVIDVEFWKGSWKTNNR